MEPLVWAGLLMLIGLLLIVLELFIPSGGVIGLTAAVCMIASVGVAFTRGPFAGLTMLLVCMLAAPLTVFLGFKIWPHTPMGRDMLNQHWREKPMTSEDPRRNLLGRVGRAKTKMLPSGAVVIDGKTYNAVSVGGGLDAGEPIRVVKIEGNSMIVKPHKGPIDPSEADEEAVLEQPLESLGIDSLDDPLA